MSDTEPTKAKAGSGWTDRERLAYLVSLIEHSDSKLNFKNAPLPSGRSLIACERMFGRLKSTLKNELEALKSGAPMPAPVSVPVAGGGSAESGGKKTTPRKRKGAVAEMEDEEKARKKGRAKKVERRDEEDEGEMVKKEEEVEEEV